MKDLIQKLKAKRNLTQVEIESAFVAIMKGAVEAEEIAEFLLALRAKIPTVEEITSAAEVMRRFAVHVKTKHRRVLDTCGTGGDKKGTFNISTIVALVVAGAGVIVAKHGNRSVSSACGSADILEALGVRIDLSVEALGKCLDDAGIAFLFAQKLHPAMKNVAAVRKDLGIDTIFNILGPLTNPANATHQVVGVYSKDFVEPLARVLKNLGLKRALVVHGSDGLDEVTTTGASFASEFDGKDISSYPISPEEYGINLVEPKELEGGDLQMNVKIAVDILKGQKGAKRDIVVLNAACALYIAEVVKSIAEGIQLAAISIDTGKANTKLEELKKFTQKYGG